MKSNLIMKKISLFILGLMAVVFITSCNKAKDNSPLPTTGTAEISFNILAGKDPSGLKDGGADCINLNKSGNYVIVTLALGDATPVDYRLDVFYIGEEPYTNTLKLAPGAYTVMDFIMMNDNMTPGTTSPTINDDFVVAAAVHAGHDYASLVAAPLTQTVTIQEFKKNTMSIELVCYEEAYYDKFGFEFFHLNQTVIREQNFFGDFCIKEVKDYDGTNTPGVTSPYVTVLGGANNILLDLPAIFQIKVYRDNVLTGTFDNNSSTKIYSPLKVTYADRIGQVDVFKFELWIMVRVGANFDYVKFHTWTENDAETIVPVHGTGEDGVVEFALGNCVPSADLVIPPWMNLPTLATYTISAFPCPVISGEQGYVGATLSGISNGYDISNGVYASNCADHETTITIGTSYPMNVYSSLYPDQLPTWVQPARWAKINWLYNHLDNFPGYQWYHIQGAIWKYDSPQWNWEAVNGMPTLIQADKDMINNMTAKMDLYGANYLVPSGGWAAILFINNPSGDSPTIQTMIVKIDP
ncbi:MAG: hypothetical protein WCK84_13535 [Bacteroidota bacterium]